VGNARAGDPDPDLDASDAASAIMRRGFIPLPSWFDPGRYRPLSPGSSRPAWLFGTGGLLIPFLSVAGVVSAFRSARRGNRAGTAAIVWCVLTASVSVAFWGPLLVGDTWQAPRTYSLDVTNLSSGADPPARLGFATSAPTASYAELDLTIRNRSGHPVPLSPATIDVSDQTGGRLAWATDDDTFLATRELTGDGTQQVHLWVALPAGRSVASVEVGDSGVDVR
jgi:hypothetical protein